MKRLFATLLLTLAVCCACAAPGGSTSENITLREPVTTTSPENSDCPDGSCPDDCPDGNCPEKDENGESDGKKTEQPAPPRLHKGGRIRRPRPPMRPPMPPVIRPTL